MEKLINIHPGEILHEEFMLPLELSSVEVAERSGLRADQVEAIRRETADITETSADGLSRCFKNSKEFWLGLQQDYDCANH